MFQSDDLDPQSLMESAPQHRAYRDGRLGHSGARVDAGPSGPLKAEESVLVRTESVLDQPSTCSPVVRPRAMWTRIVDKNPGITGILSFQDHECRALHLYWRDTWCFAQMRDAISCR